MFGRGEARREALAKIEEGFRELRACGVPADADEAGRQIVALECAVRQGQAAQVALVGEIQQAGVHLVDGHSSGRVMARHHGMLSGPEAAQRGKVAGMLADLPDVAAAYGSGRVGTCQVRRLARVWANRRVRRFLAECQDTFLDAARELEYVEFDRLCVEWEQMVDEDGADQSSQRRWRNRDVRVVRDFNTSWDMRGRLLSLDGAEVAEILSRMVDAERLSDIESARETHGDDWRDHLPRTEAQLRYDAFMGLVRRGAAAAPETGEAAVVTNVMIDQATFERELAKLTGTRPEPIEPLLALDPHRFCHTADGVPLHPGEVVARALTDYVRRVVLDSAGTVTDLGRKQRLFRGSARDAAMFQALACYWKGCWIPASKCQIDHLDPWHHEGRTNPGNGAPGCGHHNRLKERGFHAWRDPDGRWRILRPDGTEVPDHTTYWDELDRPDADRPDEDGLAA